SALPMVGEFFQRALNSRVIDPQTRFAAPQSVSSGWGQGDSAQTAPTPEPENLAPSGEPVLAPEPPPGAAPPPPDGTLPPPSSPSPSPSGGTGDGQAPSAPSTDKPDRL
ncbi:MAG: penicillin-binding protein, partial [Polaromonas sp.]|nr:penicillin-binding protein [Polaromonas sp.]